MKPISIEFQAFGPYENREFIDFEKLAESGLFLIDGKTGSGKTMILDAITFALYGKSSGSTRDDLEQLRCTHCDPNKDTFVRFTFEEKGTRYVFERSLEMGKKKLSKKLRALKINDDGTESPLLENCIERNMLAKAEELIGLNFDQFRQVIILPQGKFEKLLTSDSKDKEAILSQIFATKKWKDIADKYYEMAKATNDQFTNMKAKFDNSLADEGCSKLDELEEKVNNLKAEIKKGEEDFANANYAQKTKELNDQKALASEFATLNGYKKQLEILDAQKTDIENDIETLSKADAADKLKKPIDDLSAAKSSLSAREKNNEKAKEALEKATKNLENVNVLIAEHKSNEQQFNDNKRCKTELELNKDAYENIRELENKLATAEAAKNTLENDVNLLEQASKKALEDLGKANDELSAAEANEKMVRNSYISGIAGHLAETLTDETPCPVCGSTHHPMPATLPEGCSKAEDVENAEGITEKMKTAWNKANKAREKADHELNAKQAELSDAKTVFETAKNNVQNARKNLVEGIENIEAFNAEVERLDKEIKSYECEDEKLAKALENANNELSAAKTSVETAKTELETAEKAAETARQTLALALKETSFGSEEEAKAVMLTAEKMNSLRNQISEYNTKVEQYTKLHKELAAKLVGKTAPDSVAIETELKEIEKIVNEYNTQKGANERELKNLSDKFARLTEENKKYESGYSKASSNFTFAKCLRGDNGVGLQRYVLSIMFSTVISAANQMLKNVAGGRYTLYRTSEKIGNAHQSGLDLMVIDCYSKTKEGRSVSTLSGGEKFLTSLALSIGLASVAKTGGVDIEGIFIDEGFGTLDEECIDDALEILKSVQKQNGLVGIISHVELLRSTIYPQVLVKVDDNKASHIEIC